jgi:hypothetical protein
MRGKPWLWISLASLATVTVCCVGALVGGALARREAAVAQATSQVPVRAAQEQPASTPRGMSVEPTLSPRAPTPVPTRPPATPLPTVTPFPTPPPPVVPPASPPASSDLQALVDYANAMQPLLVEAGDLLKRDGEILKASEGGNDGVLCDGRLAADNTAMAKVLRDARAVIPPGDAAAIHDLVLRSGDAWTQALDNVRLFCDTGNQLYKIPAVVKFWEAAATLQDAGNRFWLLVIAEGVEDWVQR